jgi:hypothetical protein
MKPQSDGMDKIGSNQCALAVAYTARQANGSGYFESDCCSRRAFPVANAASECQRIANVMRILSISLLSLMLMAIGCGPAPEVRVVELKAKELVTKRAMTNEVAVAFERTPVHIYTRAEAAQYLERTSPHDKSVHSFWERLSQYPYTYAFPMPGGEMLIFFDDSGHAVNFSSNIQL